MRIPPTVRSHNHARNKRYNLYIRYNRISNKKSIVSRRRIGRGGVRGIGHVGALVEAEKRGYQWVNVAGTSAGAFLPIPQALTA